MTALAERGEIATSAAVAFPSSRHHLHRGPDSPGQVVVTIWPGETVQVVETRPTHCLDIAKQSLRCMQQEGGNSPTCANLFDSYMICQKQKAYEGRGSSVPFSICAPSK